MENIQSQTSATTPSKTSKKKFYETESGRSIILDLAPHLLNGSIESKEKLRRLSAFVADKLVLLPEEMDELYTEFGMDLISCLSGFKMIWMEAGSDNIDLQFGLERQIFTNLTVKKSKIFKHHS